MLLQFPSKIALQACRQGHPPPCRAGSPVSNSKQQGGTNSEEYHYGTIRGVVPPSSSATTKRTAAVETGVARGAVLAIFCQILAPANFSRQWCEFRPCGENGSPVIHRLFVTRVSQI